MGDSFLSMEEKTSKLQKKRKKCEGEGWGNSPVIVPKLCSRKREKNKKY